MKGSKFVNTNGATVRSTGRLMMNGSLRECTPKGKGLQTKGATVPAGLCRSLTHSKPKLRTDDRVPGLRGYARIGKNENCAPITVYFMVDDAAGVSRHTFSIHKHGFGHAYLLATEAYSALHNLSRLEEMDILGKMPDKDELCSHMAQSLLYRGVDIEEGELLGYLD